MKVQRDSLWISSDTSLLVSPNFAMKNSQKTFQGNLWSFLLLQILLGKVTLAPSLMQFLMFGKQRSFRKQLMWIPVHGWEDKDQPVWWNTMCRREARYRAFISRATQQPGHNVTAPQDLCLATTHFPQSFITAAEIPNTAHCKAALPTP